MFRIGEFAQIAQVSSRQLRHYDHLGLLLPEHTDSQSGYRFYSIRQLPRLNRILALKDLGLSLEQIGPLLENQVSSTELRGMLTMKRSQVEQSLRTEEFRLRHIESRIAQIDQQGGIEGYDVVLKPVAATPFLSLRRSFETLEDAVSMIRLIAGECTRQLKLAQRDKLIVVARNDDEDDALDLEIGFSSPRRLNTEVRVSGKDTLRPSELPFVSAMATLVRPGTNVASHSSFATIGTWIEANDYTISGPSREVFLEPITGPRGFEDALVEIQFPVHRAA
jgi:DNA-binding transcriptional MerR regulator